MKLTVISLNDVCAALSEADAKQFKDLLDAEKRHELSPLGKSLLEKAMHSLLEGFILNKDRTCIANKDAERAEKIQEIFRNIREAETIAKKEKEDSKPYFTTKNYRSLDRTHPDVQLFISQMIAITGIEKKQLKSMLWDFNPYVKYNINPGPKMISLTNRSLKSFFSHVSDVIEEGEEVKSDATFGKAIAHCLKGTDLLNTSESQSNHLQNS